MDKNEDKAINFLLGSEYFNGITFNGNFTINFNHFLIILNHFKETEENLLDAYCNVIHLSWEREEDLRGYGLNNDKNIYLADCISKVRELRVLNPEIIRSALWVLNVYKENYRKHKEWKFNKPRRIAQAFIQKKEVREEVFEIHGKICLCCGSEKDITIDHIVPVFKDGENSIDNLQPLCRSCNSRKSTNEIDYR